MKISVEDIYRTFRTPQGVIDHCQKVSEVADILTKGLLEKGHEIRHPETVYAAAIHDALRVCDFVNFDPKDFPHISENDMNIWLTLRKEYGPIGHAEGLARYLEQQDEPYIANIVRLHDFHQVDKLQTWEEKIVYYSDKRVNQDRIEPLLDRLEAGRKRNLEPGAAENPERTDTIKKIQSLEQEFISELGEFVYSLQG